MATQMNIPKKMHVGFIERKDTYSGKLAYITYTDEKGKLRKEMSWNNWKSNKIPVEHYDNEPTQGFVINRDGGGRGYSSWDSRKAFVRVHDPRGFEIEIAIWNLLFILQECTSTKGKGLDGEFVYGWSGKDLVLIPTQCKEYTESIEFTSLKTQKVTQKEMVKGYTYLSKNQNNLIYLGRHSIRPFKRYYHRNPLSRDNALIKSHVFYDTDLDELIFEKGFTKLAQVIEDSVSPEFTQLHADLLNSKHCSEYLGKCFAPISKDELNAIEYYPAPIILVELNNNDNVSEVVLFKTMRHTWCNDSEFQNRETISIPSEYIHDEEKNLARASSIIHEFRSYMNSNKEISISKLLSTFPDAQFYLAKYQYASGVQTQV